MTILLRYNENSVLMVREGGDSRHKLEFRTSNTANVDTDADWNIQAWREVSSMHIYFSDGTHISIERKKNANNGQSDPGTGVVESGASPTAST